ncbi:Endoplasmic reticulum-Golgi intermediate compartment protein 3 [Balamuthia mandrillaris]
MHGGERKSFHTRLRALDVFPKLDETVPRLRSPVSGFLSLICGLFLAYLLLSEVYDFWAVGVASNVTVDQSREKTVDIHLDMDILGMNCPDFGFDVTDASGQLWLSATAMEGSELQKTPLQGAPNKKGKAGCKVHGQFWVSKVAGEFHVGLGKDTHKSGAEHGHEAAASHVHHFTMPELYAFNSSHHIHSLKFGPPLADVVQPLEDLYIVDPEGETYRYTYKLQVVPTQFKSRSGKVINTFQYSFTSNKQWVDKKASTFWQPGVFFAYEFSPYQVTYEENPRSLAHFLTRTCAILGGIFVVFGWLSSAYFHAHRLKKD